MNISVVLHRNMKYATAMLLTTEMKYSYYSSSRSDRKVALKRLECLILCNMLAHSHRSVGFFSVLI